MPEQWIRLQFMSNQGPAPLGTRTHSACVRGIGDFYVGEMVKAGLLGKDEEYVILREHEVLAVLPE